MSNLNNIISQIVSRYGESILGDSPRLKALFSDLARDVSKPQKMAFLACLEAGFGAILKNTSDIKSCKKILSQRLHDTEGFDITLCIETLDTLERVMFDKITENIIAEKTVEQIIIPEEINSVSYEKNNNILISTLQNKTNIVKNINALFISRIAAAAVSFIGIANLPYNYYTLLRITIFVISIINAINYFYKNKFIFLLFCITALLFNPLFSFHFNKEIWQALDLINGTFFTLSLLFN